MKMSDLKLEDIEHLKTTPQYPFISELVNKMSFRELSDNESMSLKNVLEAAEKVYTETENAPDVIPQKNYHIRGKIKATTKKGKYQNYRCLIHHENGQHFWGNIPKAILKYDSRTLTFPNNLIGFEVEFTATIDLTYIKNPKLGSFIYPRNAKVIKPRDGYGGMEEEIARNEEKRCI